jgi:hypothetical protein
LILKIAAAYSPTAELGTDENTTLSSSSSVILGSSPLVIGWLDPKMMSFAFFEEI